MSARHPQVIAYRDMANDTYRCVGCGPTNPIVGVTAADVIGRMPPPRVCGAPGCGNRLVKSQHAQPVVRRAVAGG